MAHIQKRGPNRWRARYRGPDGRERSRTFRRRADAERYLAQAQVDQARGAWVDPRLGRVTFAAWVEAWLQTVSEIRDTTRHRQQGILDNYLLPRFGDFALGRISRVDVRAFIAELCAGGSISAGTVRKVGHVLSRIMAGAVDAGLIPRSPCERLPLPPEGRREMAFLSPAQVEALASAIHPHYAPLVYTASYAGLRWGELAGLRVERVNPLQRTLSVVEQLTEVAGTLAWGPPKTKAGCRTVTLPRFLAVMLEEQVASAPVVCSGIVFPTPEGQPMRRSNFRRRIWGRATRAVGLQGVRFHDLRHTTVAFAIAQGAHPKAIQERMGHSSITMTMDRYGHLFPALDERIADGLDELYAGALGVGAR